VRWSWSAIEYDILTSYHRHYQSLLSLKKTLEFKASLINKNIPNFSESASKLLFQFIHREGVNPHLAFHIILIMYQLTVSSNKIRFTFNHFTHTPSSFQNAEGTKLLRVYQANGIINDKRID
jgi:hypothetical protein